MENYDLCRHEDSMKVAVVILTLNAGAGLEKLLKGIQRQNLKISRKVIADSASTDETLVLAQKYHYEILPMSRQSFNHGDARKACAEFLTDMDIVIFLTQDVIVSHDDSFSKLLACFSVDKVGVAYGRQLPHNGASPMAVQNRLFNYPPQSQIKSYDDRLVLGLKTAFTSDSFAAYRNAALRSIGSFPHVIVSEDMYVAAKLLMAGYQVAYVAESCVYHSHDYTLQQEFNRYFDIGVFMGREKWIQAAFGGAEGEGAKLLKNQLCYLYEHYGLWSIPKALLVNIVKFCAYRLGIYERFLPKWMKRKISGQAYFFNE